MAQKRMIDKKISVSEQVANLSIPAQLVYTWGMPHADDIGMLSYSNKTLKATIVPIWEMLTNEFAKLIDEIVNQKLWEEYEYNQQKFYHVKNFTRYQILKRDRQPQTILPVEFSENPKTSWKTLETIAFQLENIGLQLEPEEKRREEKRREGKNILFDDFWSIYPKKIGKKKTKELWDDLTHEDQLKAIADIPRRKVDRKWIGGFIKDPERYIKNEQWNDEIIEDVKKETPTDRFKK